MTGEMRRLEPPTPAEQRVELLRRIRVDTGISWRPGDSQFKTDVLSCLQSVHLELAAKDLRIVALEREGIEAREALRRMEARLKALERAAAMRSRRGW